MTDPTVSKKETVHPLPCPFCGSRRYSAQRLGGPWSIECVECECLGPTANTIKGAKEAWNRRYGE